MINISGGITIYPKIIKKHLDEELPFMATENILMYCVKKGLAAGSGQDRQVLHERIRLHSVEAAKKIKLDGAENDLISKIAQDASFNVTHEELFSLLNAENFTGRAKEQTEEFLSGDVKRVLEANKEFLGADAVISV
jgi:adenylosuccinate lyase